MAYRAIVYRLSDGVLIGTVEAEAAGSVGVPPEFGMVPGDFQPGSHYRVVDGEVVERPAIAVTVSADTIAADGVDECVLSGLPDPCIVTVRGVVSAGPLEVTGGSLTLTSTALGPITISITADPVWRPWDGVINAA
jgi:hypothetical protein